MSVLVVSGRLSPTCGVWDYATRLTAALNARGTPARLVGIDGLAPASRILFQWVPYLYGRRGLPVALVAKLVALSRRCPVDLVVHEPFVDWSWGRLGLLSAAQRVLLGTLAAAGRRLYTPVTAWVKLLGAYPGAAGKVSWVPVGSNIPVVAARGPRAALTMGIFSPLGSGRDPGLLEEAWAAVRSREKGARLIVLGASREALRDYPELAEHAAGFLPPEAISERLSQMDVLISPFVDGISARRSAPIAAMAHGVPVVSTAGRLTDPLFYGSPVRLTSATADTLAREALSAARSPDLSARTRLFHDTHFSWPSIAQRLG